MVEVRLALDRDGNGLKYLRGRCGNNVNVSDMYVQRADVHCALTLE